MSNRILIVDDDQLLLDLLTHLLSRIGYEVEQALESGEALERLTHREFDAIFLDMKMPKMDGKEFYSKVQEQAPGFLKRIIFVTGDVANPATITFLKETGNFHLSKPFTIGEVRTLLHRFFQGTAPSSDPLDMPQ